MKRLIVTADDFGLTEGVVAGIVAAHRDGIVTATSMMVGAPAIDAASDYARKHTSLALGLHFVLTFGRPTGPTEPLGDILDDNGRFRRLEEGVHAQLTPSRVLSELEAQLNAFESRVGRPPTHIDGHHHVHALPGVLPAVIEHAHRLGAPVRAPDDATRDRLRLAGVATSDRFVDSFYGDGQVSSDALVSRLRAIPDGTSELMCHPAREDTVLKTLSSYCRPRYEELRALTDPAVRAAVDDESIELVPTVR